MRIIKLKNSYILFYYHLKVEQVMNMFGNLILPPFALWHKRFSSVNVTFQARQQLQVRKSYTYLLSIFCRCTVHLACLYAEIVCALIHNKWFIPQKSIPKSFFHYIFFHGKINFQTRCIFILTVEGLNQRWGGHRGRERWHLNCLLTFGWWLS